MKKIYLLLLLLPFSALKMSAQITFVSSAQAVGSTVNVTVSAPSGIMANDVLIAAVHCGWCNSGGPITAPAGWIAINQTSNTGSGCGSSNTTIQLATFYKIATASEPSTYTFTGNTNQLYVGGIAAYRGVNTTTPINMNSNNGAQDACGAITTTGVTTTSACTKLVNIFICSVNSSATNIIPTASLTERLDVSTTGNHPWGNENLEISDENFSSAGATGNRTAALSGCSGTGWVTAGQMIALECASATGIEESVLNSFAVNPNPSNGQLTISISSVNQKCELQICDQLGRILRSENLQKSQTTIDASELPKGIYFVKIISAEGTAVRKIVLQ
ncbi:MAG: T9SS type A sorting domain-containing protein [Bacteroidia bacterium]